MGRRSLGPKVKKRKKVLVTPAVKMQDGKLTEPYQIMANLIEKHRDDLEEAEIVILWRSGWRADADGWVQMVNVKKAGDVDRALSVKADFAVMLNKERFPALPEQMKIIYLHHALEHMRPMMDSDGEQKQDDKGRVIWRVKKRHDVEQFEKIIEVYGKDSLNLDKEALEAINDAKRPLLKEAEKAAKSNDNGKTAKPGPNAPGVAVEWRSFNLYAALLDEKEVDILETAGIKNLGQLEAAASKNREHWRAEFRIDRPRKGILEKFNAYLVAVAKEKPIDGGTDEESGGGDSKQSVDWKAWGTEILTEYGLPAGKLKLLQEAGSTTMGKLLTAMRKNGSEDFWWKDIRGFGESGYDALTEAIVALRKARPEFQADEA